MADTSGKKTEQTINSLDELVKSIKDVNYALKSQSKAIDKVSEELSNAGVDKFTKEIQDAIKKSGLLTAEQEDNIKSLRDLSKATQLLEDKYNELATLRATRDKKAAAAQALDAKARSNEIFKANAEYTAELLRLGYANKQAADAALAQHEAYKANVTSITNNIGAHDKLNKKLEGLGTSIQDKVAKFATLGAAATLLKKAFSESYEQMNRLSSKGMLGAFTSINLMAPKLLLLPKEFEELINKNRSLVNAFGGGIDGIKEFGDEVSKQRDGLEYLGRDASKASARFIEVSQNLGVTKKDGDAYGKVMKTLKGQFKEFSALYGDSYEDTAKLVEQQASEEGFRRRLNGLSKDQIAVQYEELAARNSNLKMMGLSNDQLIEFNKRLEDMYNPRKNTQIQRRTEAANFMGEQSSMMMLAQGNPGLQPELQALQATGDAGNKFAQIHASNNKQAMAAFMVSPEGKAYLQARNNLKAKIGTSSQDHTNGLDDMSPYGMTMYGERSGGLGQVADDFGQAVQTAHVQQRDVSPEQAKARADATKDLIGDTGAMATAFHAATIAVEGFNSIMANPLANAAMGAVAALLAVSGLGGKMVGLIGKLAGIPGAGGAGAFGAGGLAKNALGMAGRGALVAGAGVAGWEIGTHVVNPLLDAGATAITGQDNSFGTAIYGGVQKMKGMLGFQDNDKAVSDMLHGTGASGAQAPKAMTSTGMTGVNNVKNWGKASDSTKSAILSAAQRVGVDPTTLAAMANKESSFNPNAQASTSSASGLFQFIDSTWLDTIKKYGPKYGVDVGNMSNAQLLQLRSDPNMSALMGAEFMKQNQAITGDSSAGGTYLAHFLGAGGAKNVLQADPNTPIGQVVSASQIASNPSVFRNINTAGDLQRWASSAMGVTAGGSAGVQLQSNNSTATGMTAVAQSQDTPITELKKQTSLLSIIAANTNGGKPKAQDTSYKSAHSVVSNNVG